MKFKQIPTHMKVQLRTFIFIISVQNEGKYKKKMLPLLSVLIAPYDMKKNYYIAVHSYFKFCPILNSFIQTYVQILCNTLFRKIFTNYVVSRQIHQYIFHFSDMSYYSYREALYGICYENFKNSYYFSDTFT